jgi:hypothetical protein
VKTLIEIINLLSHSTQTMSQLIQPLDIYPNSGELNFACDDVQATLEALQKNFADAQFDFYRWSNSRISELVVQRSWRSERGFAKREKGHSKRHDRKCELTRGTIWKIFKKYPFCRSPHAGQPQEII